MDADGFVRLVNLEAAKYVGQGELTHTLCGVPEYMAPEMLLGQGHRTGADWWALGCLVFEMLTSVSWEGLRQEMMNALRRKDEK